MELRAGTCWQRFLLRKINGLFEGVKNLLYFALIVLSYFFLTLNGRVYELLKRLMLCWK